MADQWEYKIVMATGTSADEKTLNGLGAQGFDLVGIGQLDRGTPNPGTTWYVLKRRKP